MQRQLFLRSAALALLLLGLPGSLWGQSKLQGICFSATRDGESPALQINPLPSTVRQDVRFASRVTNAIRTYSVQGSHYLIPEYCQEFDVDCVVGAWIGKARWQNDAQVELLIRLAGANNPRIKSVIVGNEVLHRGDCTSKQLIEYVRRVKESVDVPVGVAETWKAWVDHPELASEVDFCAVQAYPYWEGMGIDGAAAYTVDRLRQIRDLFPDQQIVLSEFGWPTAGESKGNAIASPENAARYLREILPLLDANNFDYYYFSLWDENWKVGAEGGVGAHWGLFHSDGGVKEGMKDQLPAESVAGSTRPARIVTFQQPEDESRNAAILRAAYPPADVVNEQAQSKQTQNEQAAQTGAKAVGRNSLDPTRPSPDRGPGLQAIVGSGIRIDLSTRTVETRGRAPDAPNPALKSSHTTDVDDIRRTQTRADSHLIENDQPNTRDKAAPGARGSNKDVVSFSVDELDTRFKRTLQSNELYGLCLSLFRDNESPHTGVMPLVAELHADIAHAKQLARLVRTYSVTETFSLIPELCDDLEVDCIPGAALGKYPWLNDTEIEMLIRVGQGNHPSVKAVIVGNEVMHRHDFSIQQYIDYIRRVKRSVKVPVATAELLHTWMEHPELADEVDILGVQIYPYWGGLGIESAATDTLERVKELQAAHPTKRVMLTEFGWPTAGGNLGGAVASPENAARYFRETIPLLNQNGIEYFYFAMTDEEWKQGDEGGPGANWGLLNADGTVKPTLKSLLPAAAGMSRPTRSLGFDDE